MAARCLAVELEAELLQTLDDLPIAETGKPPRQTATTKG